MKRMVAIAAAAMLLGMTACSDQSGNADTAAETSLPESSATEASELTETSDDSSAVSDLSQYGVTDPFSYEAGTPEVSGDLDTRKEVSFYRDGIRIYGKLYLPEGDGPFPVVVLCSGQLAPYSYYTDEAEKCAENGYAALVFDFAGNVARSNSGGSLTDYSVLTEAKDLNVILDSLSALPKVDTENVFLFGHSLGGLTAAYIGCSRPDDVKGMILLEPSFGYPDYARETSPDLSQVPDIIPDVSLYNANVGKIFVVDMHAVDIFSMMPQFDRDVLVILGTQNALGESMPEVFERAAEAFPSAEIEKVEGADHYFQDEAGETAAQMLIDFVSAHI